MRNNWDEDYENLISTDYLTEVTSCRFVENKAPNGGALYAISTVDKCEFIDNVAEFEGNAIAYSHNIKNSNFKSSKNKDEFIVGYVDMILKDNQMTSSNNYDIKVTRNIELPVRTMQTEINLVFDSKTVAPNSTFKIAEIQDDHGNNIVFEGFDELPVIKAKLTNKQTSDVKSVDVRYDSELKGFYYESDDDEGTYDVTGYADFEAIDACNIINGVFYTRLTNASGYVRLNINCLREHLSSQQSITDS